MARVSGTLLLAIALTAALLPETDAQAAGCAPAEAVAEALGIAQSLAAEKLGEEEAAKLLLKLEEKEIVLLGQICFLTTDFADFGRIVAEFFEEHLSVSSRQEDDDWRPTFDGNQQDDSVAAPLCECLRCPSEHESWCPSNGVRAKCCPHYCSDIFSAISVGALIGLRGSGVDSCCEKGAVPCSSTPKIRRNDAKPSPSGTPPAMSKQPLPPKPSTSESRAVHVPLGSPTPSPSQAGATNDVVFATDNSGINGLSQLVSSVTAEESSQPAASSPVPSPTSDLISSSSSPLGATPSPSYRPGQNTSTDGEETELSELEPSTAALASNAVPRSPATPSPVPQQSGSPVAIQAITTSDTASGKEAPADQDVLSGNPGVGPTPVPIHPSHAQTEDTAQSAVSSPVPSISQSSLLLSPPGTSPSPTPAHSGDHDPTGFTQTITPSPLPSAADANGFGGPITVGSDAEPPPPPAFGSDQVPTETIAAVADDEDPFE